MTTVTNLISDTRLAGRYVLFTPEDYYPQGGWGDFAARCDDLDALIQLGTKAVKSGGCSAHIIDLTTCLPVWANNEWYAQNITEIVQKTLTDTSGT